MKTKSDSNIYRIGNEGNQIEIDYLGKGEYRLICRDHYSENFIDYYMDEGFGLADYDLWMSTAINLLEQAIKENN